MALGFAEQLYANRKLLLSQVESLPQAEGEALTNALVFSEFLLSEQGQPVDQALTPAQSALAATREQRVEFGSFKRVGFQTRLAA